MQIDTNKIFEFLDKEKIKYKVFGNLKNNYEIASIFEPIKNGFYFFTGIEFPTIFEDSVILVNQRFILEEKSTNAIIETKKDSQLIYYKLLSELFSLKSDGIISPNAIIHPDAEIGKNVSIGHFSIIGKVKIGNNCIIKNHCVLEDQTIIGDNVQIEDGSIIGTQGVAWLWNEDKTNKIVQPQLGGVFIGSNSFLGANTIVVRGSLSESTIIGQNCLFAPGCRLGHGTKIGDFTHLANNVITGGNTQIGNNNFIGSSVVFRPKVKTHAGTVVGAGAVVVKNTTSKNKLLVGIPAKENELKNQLSGIPNLKN